VRTRRVRATAVACGVLAAGGLGGSVVSTEAQVPGPPTGTLQLEQRDRDVRFRFVDVHPRRRGVAVGDSFVITGAVRDQGGNRAGRVQAVLVVTNARREQAEVSGTFVLSGGSISVSGAETRARVDEFAVTGGTGSYMGARGTLTLTERRRSTTFLFTFIG
jgi:hypothetical protein